MEFEDGRNLYYVSDRNICKVKSLFSNLPDKGGKNDGRLGGFETCQDLKCKQNEATGMITEEDKDTIVRCAKGYDVESVILFGSSTRDDIESNDIDIGVKGTDPRLFFKFYAELFKRLPKPVDLVDISRKSLFNDLVEETGVRIYG